MALYKLYYLLTYLLNNKYYFIINYAEIDGRNPRNGVSGTDRQMEKKLHCFVLRDVSSMEAANASEPEVHKDHVTSGLCADDVNVFDAIETCRGVRPILMSDNFIDRRINTSGKRHTYIHALPLCVRDF